MTYLRNLLAGTHPPRQTPTPGRPAPGQATATTPHQTQTTTRQKEEILTARPVQTRLLPSPNANTLTVSPTT
jgi:hypothetical protein